MISSRLAFDESPVNGLNPIVLYIDFTNVDWVDIPPIVAKFSYSYKLNSLIFDSFNNIVVSNLSYIKTLSELPTNITPLMV